MSAFTQHLAVTGSEYAGDFGEWLELATARRAPAQLQPGRSRAARDAANALCLGSRAVIGQGVEPCRAIMASPRAEAPRH